MFFVYFLGSCDDIGTITTPMPTLPPTITPEKQSCNFEDGFCAWKQRSDDDFDWDRKQGHTNRYELRNWNHYQVTAKFNFFSLLSYLYTIAQEILSDCALIIEIKTSVCPSCLVSKTRYLMFCVFCVCYVLCFVLCVLCVCLLSYD